MARLSVPDLLIDPDFTDQVGLLRRTVTVDNYGEAVLAETATTITAVVQGVGTEMLDRLPQGAVLSDYIEVWHKGKLHAQSNGGAADVIVWAGQRWQVMEVTEDFMNHPAGYCRATCQVEAVSAAGGGIV